MRFCNWGNDGLTEETWHLEWHLDRKKDLLVVHVFPHRTFLLKSDQLSDSIIPFLAGIMCFNVILGQENKKTVNVESKNPLPEELEKLSNHLKKISKGKFKVKFNNLNPLIITPQSTKKVLLFSGGKDSLWQLKYLEKNNLASKLILLYISGTTVAGEYHKELDAIKKQTNGRELKIVTLESFDYSSIGLNFRLRPRWRTLVLITIASMFSNEIWTGISHDKRFITGEDKTAEDDINFFSELPTTLEILANSLDSDIWLSPPESYCYFDLDKEKYPYRSCYSPDVVCSPETDFTNSCWKCRTLYIYNKIGKGEQLSEEEDAFAESDDWPGDIEEEIIRFARKSETCEPFCVKGKYQKDK